jgi:hypothetical protein
MANPEFDWGAAADLPGLGGVHDAETTLLIKEYAEYLEGPEHSKLLVPRLADLLGAGGHGMVSGTQTKQDFNDEHLHSRVDITKLLEANHPGPANSDVRALKAQAVQLVEDMAACMLANLSDHITGPCASTLKTLRDRGERGYDDEYTRRHGTGCSIYLLNYLICCAILECPEARSESVKRAVDWHKPERKKHQGRSLDIKFECPDTASASGGVGAAAAWSDGSESGSESGSEGGKAGRRKALVARVAAAAQVVLATKAATNLDGRDPGKRKRATREESSSDEPEDSAEERAAVSAAVRTVLAAQRADAKAATKKARKGAAQLSGSRDD